MIRPKFGHKKTKIMGNYIDNMIYNYIPEPDEEDEEDS